MFVAPGALALGNDILRSFDDLADERTIPAGARVGIGVVLAVIVTFGALVALYGAGLLIAGVGDLVRRRRVVEGRVLRLRERGDDNKRFWHVAVDDGTTDRVRAWRVRAPGSVHQGATVRARVSPWLRHVADLTLVRADDHAIAAVPTAAPVTVAPAVAVPPLPDATAVTAALGTPVAIDAGATRHPLAIDGASRTFVTPDGGRVITAWIQPGEIDAHRHMPPALATAVSGLGDETYRSPVGGGIVTRVDGNVLMVVATLPALDDQARDRAISAVAHATLTAAAAR